uniref:Col_cuticle_N domain-containing protein n=1 Tax=Parastrongyloides trichosuri TaxID=131310 RepID=A0A0N4ZNH8_PARTI
MAEKHRIFLTLSISILSIVSSITLISLVSFCNDMNIYYENSLAQLQEFQITIKYKRDYKESYDAIPEVKDCECNEIGEPGPEGIPGPDGFPGLPGKHGTPGVSGSVDVDSYRTQRDCLSCPMGPPGPKGKPGKKGKKGKNGPKGKDGSEGKTGEQGPPGPPGEAGKPGNPGKDGEEGPKGKDSTIEKGIPGSKGPEGPAGPPGKVGLDGEPGKEGSPGPEGKIGPAGKSGKDGDDGKVGKPGAKGDNGKDAGYCPCVPRTSAYGDQGFVGKIEDSNEIANSSDTKSTKEDSKYVEATEVTTIVLKSNGETKTSSIPKKSIEEDTYKTLDSKSDSKLQDGIVKVNRNLKH